VEGKKGSLSDVVNNTEMRRKLPKESEVVAGWQELGSAKPKVASGIT
jgi:hypothetical protein